MSRLLARNQAIVLSTGSLVILALVSLMLTGALGTEQWLMLSLAVFLASDAIAGHYASERLRIVSAIAFFICVSIFFIAAAGRLMAILGILL